MDRSEVFRRMSMRTSGARSVRETNKNKLITLNTERVFVSKTSRVGRVFGVHQRFPRECGGPRRRDPPYDSAEVDRCRNQLLSVEGDSMFRSTVAFSLVILFELCGMLGCSRQTKPAQSDVDAIKKSLPPDVSPTNLKFEGSADTEPSDQEPAKAK